MDNVYESIITGLTEAIEDAKGQKKNYIEEHILLSERYEDQLKAVEWAKAEQARILKEKEKRLTKELKEKMTPIIMQAKKDKTQ